MFALIRRIAGSLSGIFNRCSSDSPEQVVEVAYVTTSGLSVEAVADNKLAITVESRGSSPSLARDACAARKELVLNSLDERKDTAWVSRIGVFPQEDSFEAQCLILVS